MWHRHEYLLIQANVITQGTWLIGKCKTCFKQKTISMPGHIVPAHLIHRVAEEFGWHTSK